MASNSFGLEIGEKFTRLADVNPKGGFSEPLVVGSTETFPYFYDAASEKNIEAQANIISQLLNKLKINKKNVHLVMPDFISFSQVMEVPRLNEKELQSAIRYQADQFIPMPIDEVSLDLEILREDAKTKKAIVLLVAAPKKIIDQVERAVAYAGLLPISLENEFSAFRRLVLEGMKIPATQTYVVVNFGFNNSSIYLIDPRTSSLLSRTVKYGYSLFHKAVKVNMNIDDHKAAELLGTAGFAAGTAVNLDPYLSPLTGEMATEVSKFLMLARERFGSPAQSVYLYNHSFMINQLDRKLAQLLGTAMVPFNSPLYLVQNNLAKSLADAPGYVSAVAANFW